MAGMKIFIAGERAGIVKKKIFLQEGILRRMKLKRLMLIIIPIVLAVSAWSMIRPSGDRNWAVDQAEVVSVSIEDSIVSITNVRHFDHCPDGGGPASTAWRSGRYDLRDMKNVWLVISLFNPERRGPAHPFLSFQFGDSSFVAVSVEARRESDESYSIWKGMMKRFELIYIVADENDIITLRALCRDDIVYIYPLITTPEKARELFIDITERAERLGREPEFYNTIWNNCTTNILEHANVVASEKIPGGLYTFLPGYSDKVALTLGLIDAEGSIDQVRERFQVNERVRKYAGGKGFSLRIREVEQED
ncbi:MAG: DUF4105 domain-containing protein [Candidatus Krumholzibacteriota bacterium]|nr:DUF4105 domain-containing protein [Candidatus Krumholzibacteriota bacterium]